MSAVLKALGIFVVVVALGAATGFDGGRVGATIRTIIARIAANAPPPARPFAVAPAGGASTPPTATAMAAPLPGEVVGHGIPVAPTDETMPGVPVVPVEANQAGVPVVAGEMLAAGVPVVAAADPSSAASALPGSALGGSAPAPIASATPSQPSWPPATNAAGSTIAGSNAADPLLAWGRAPAPNVDPRRFTEAHWQGIEVVPNTPALATALKIDPSLAGVIVDDVTLPADLQGFAAGDVITAVGETPTPDLLAFIQASEIVRDTKQAALTVIRKGQTLTLMLNALLERLGDANGETPSMIPPGARMPHPYRGACTNCHRIGTTGSLAVDQGDPIVKTAPPIAAGASRPHEDRGACTACHQIVP